MSGRPHESPDCRCDACVRYDREQEDAQWPYGYWSDSEVALYMRGSSAYEVERAAWRALVDMYDEVFRDDTRDDS